MFCRHIASTCLESVPWKSCLSFPFPAFAFLITSPCLGRGRTDSFVSIVIGRLPHSICKCFLLESKYQLPLTCYICSHMLWLLWLTQTIWTYFLGRLHFFWHEDLWFLPRKDLPQDPILHPLNSLHTEASHSLVEKIQNILVLSWGTLQSNPLERMRLKRTPTFTNVIALYFTAFWPDGRSYELKSDYEPWIQFQVLKIYPSDWVKLWISAGSHQSLFCWRWVEKVRQHYN